jgi:hypothetical protein
MMAYNEEFKAVDIISLPNAATHAPGADEKP